MSKKYTFEYIKDYFNELGCELLEETYKDNNTLMEYRCKCGNISKIRFRDFKNGQRCWECGNKKIGEKTKHSFKYVCNYFKENNCELLEKEYINSYTKMKYRCSCGDVSSIRFCNFQEGQKCRKCGIKKNSGKNNHNYNSNLTDEDRVDRRSILGYKEWIINIYKKDNYVCQKCKIKKDNREKYKKLNAHHIEGYAENKDLRTDVSNGITFCADCHNLFHSKYGKKNVNKSQLEEFLSKVINDDSLIISV